MTATQYQQATSPMRVSSPLGEDVLLAKRLRGTEAVSVPFRFTLDLLSTNRSIDPVDLLGKPLETTIDCEDGEQRVVHGIVSRFARVGDDVAFAAYRAEVVPAFALLALSSDCRVFQHLSVQQILEQIFREHEVADVRIELHKTHAEREYCVMFRESYLAFAARLMDEEGISYCFVHTPGHHEMLVTDDLAAAMGGAPLPLRMAPDETPGEERDVVLELERERAVVTGRVTVSDYDYLKPKTSLEAGSEGKGTGELYHYPGAYLVKDEGEAIARRRLEAREWPGDVVRGASACARLACGGRFALADHASRDLNRDYRVLEVTHDAEFGGWRSGDGAGFKYRSTFVAIPADVPHRPRRAPRKPLVSGLQSAVVVGPGGEEIYTDKYGRVKLQFHWDREGKRDEQSSCWVRVSSLWAGKNWGAIHLPRVGQEVLVEFLDGDVDRPIVTGRVYNAEQMPPYALPDNGTQSGLKTRSSKKGGPSDANELRFEDKAGEEQILLHAEKDLVVEVEHDEKTTVENDRTDEVGHDEKTTVKHDRTDEVQGNETRKILGKRSTKVTQSDALEVSMDRTEKVSMSLEVQAGTTITIKAGAELKLESPGGTITIGPAGISIQSPTMVTVKGPMVMIN